MAQISEDELNTLLTGLYESLCKFASSYKSDNNITKNNADDYLSRILSLANDVKKAVNDKKTICDVTIYDAYINRFSVIAEHIINKKSGFFGDKELLILANAIKDNITILNKTKENFIAAINQKNNAHEETSKNNEIQQQLKELMQESAISKQKLAEVEKKLDNTAGNIKRLGSVLQLISIKANDEQYDMLTTALATLDLPLPQKISDANLITDSDKPTLTSNNTTAITSEFYFPFPELKDDEDFAIKNFDSTLLKSDKSRELKVWKEKEENKIAYDKLKLSESVNANLYAAIVKLSLFIKQYNSKDSSSLYKQDNSLIESAKKVLFNLVKSWDQPWAECKQNVIIPAIVEAPHLLKKLLTEISSFNYKETTENNNLYGSNERKRQGIGSVVCHMESERFHLMPVNNDIALANFFKETAQQPNNNFKKFVV